MNGYPTVEKREPYPWMPELVSCYDWADLEEQRTPYPGEGRCTRDMKSIFTTAVRMYGYERLYLELDSGNNVFSLIGGEMVRWTKRLLETVPIDWILIGDDIAHNLGLFFPPRMLQPLFDQYCELRHVAMVNGAQTIYHSDGDVSEAWEDLQHCADKFMLQTDIFCIQDERIIDHQVDMAWASYATREEHEGGV